MINTTVLFAKKDGKLIPASAEDHAKLELFNKSLAEGEYVEVYLSQYSSSDKTVGQLAKVHASIRELAQFTGHDFSEVKQMVKVKAGLYSSEDGSLKSFGDCTKQELGSAIEACISIGHTVGYYLS